MPPQPRTTRPETGAVRPAGFADAILAVGTARAAFALRLLSAFADGRGERPRPATVSDAGFRDPML